MPNMQERFLLLLGASSVVLPVLSEVGPYAQCGGGAWTGDTVCKAGYTCASSHPDYAQCLPAASVAATSTSQAPHSGSGTSTSASSSVTSPPASKTSSSSTAASSTTPSTSLPLASTAPTTPPSKEVGKLPALGWNGWNAYACDISEAKVVAAAQSFVDLGLKDAGYEYVNIDDCWAEMSRDANNTLVPDPTKFPDGIKGTADKVHALGLKIGIYSDAGTNTCAGYPGSLGFEEIDAKTWDSWGIDYLKYDNCNIPSNWTDAASPPDGNWYDSNSAIRYRYMGAAIADGSRPVQMDLCIWGEANVWEWGARVGHSWRMAGDASANWDYITSIMVTNVQHLDTIDFFAHNDMDMMEIGNGDLTMEEQRTHFAVWAFLKSPILLGTDLSKLSAAQVAIITNKELLAFSQDAKIGTPAHPFASSTAPAASPPQFYAGASARGTHVFVVNTGAAAANFTVAFADVPGLARGGKGRFKVHDMWTGAENGTYAGQWTVLLAEHDTAAVLLTPA
ncbi:glycoside hydrolase [Dentipellis sp. KUC8613]|nr:glycoside hydrolase [Dentipellis sp. KUC8613]